MTDTEQVVLVAEVTRALEQRGVERDGDELKFRCFYPERHEHRDEHPSAYFNPKKAVWLCRVCKVRGGLLDLADRLGVPRPSRAGVAPPRLEDFARARCLSPETLRRFGVRPVVESGRPALRYPTPVGIDRLKFLDERKPKYRWKSRGGRSHWYDWDCALASVRAGASVLFLVNGEVSVWACAQAGVAALCACGGEVARPTPDMVEQLATTLREVGRPIALHIVYDADAAGRRGALQHVQPPLAAAGLDVQVLDIGAAIAGVPGADVDDLHRRVGDAGLAAALAALSVLTDAATAEPEGDDDGEDRGTRDTPWTHTLSAPAFLAQMEDTPDWLIDGVLMPGAITRLNSPRGLGKTNLGHAWAVMAARAAHQVLLFDRDNPKAEIRRRLRAWGAAEIEHLHIISREHAPALTDARAWRQFPIGKYDLIVIDSWDASTEGVGEQDSAKPSKAQAVLLDLAHRANGPAILVLANTVKSGEAGRGAGTLEDREDIVCEVRDATGFTPTGQAEWWLGLPDASRGAWAARAARRVKQDRQRLAVTYSKCRVSPEREPFVAEVDFTTSPWSLRLVTAEVVAAGEAAKDATEQQAADRATDAMAKLRDEIVGRTHAGEEPYSKTTAARFLTVLGVTWKRAYVLIEQGIGTHWRLVELTTKRGKPMVLVPVESPSTHSKSPTSEEPAAEGLAAPLFVTPAPSTDVTNTLDGNACAAMGSERGDLQRAGVGIPPSRAADGPISNPPTGSNRDESPPRGVPADPYGPTPPATPCRTCGGDAWHRAGSGWTCGICHPIPTALPHPPGDSTPDHEPAALLALAAQHGWCEIEYTPGHRIGGSEVRWETFARGGLPEARRAALAVLEHLATLAGGAR